MLGDGGSGFSRLEEDITCSLCLGELQDVVATECGHTFCRDCIWEYWGPLRPTEARCPECRKPCANKKLIPIYRLQSMVTKVQHPAARDRQVPGSAIQLAYADSRGRLRLDESVVRKCFLDEAIAHYPVCLICAIGETRRGKSTLLNYILRALQRRERGQPFCLGQEEEPLTGFEWRRGTNRVTKGIWIWSRPFILERNGEKMAVYVVDTEGCRDLEVDQGTCNKLSALSILLSSYLIFNVSKGLRTTELEYLEMYLHIAEVMGASFSVQHMQHVDIVVRDWPDADQWGREAARTYLERQREKFQKQSSDYGRALEALRSPCVSGFLLPHPGETFPGSNQGRLEDMDEDFRDHLTTYISDVGGAIRRHQKTNLTGEKITCARLGRALQEFAGILQDEQYSFASPLQIMSSFKNYRNTNIVLKTFQDFLEQQISLSSGASAFRVLGMKPSQMRSRVSEQASLLLERYSSVLKGEAAEKRKLLDRMESLLLVKQDKFCAAYSNRFTKCAVGVGCAFGGVGLAVAGGIVGAAAASMVFAAEAVGILGSSTMAMVTGAVGGSVTLGAIGTGVGAGVGSVFGHVEKKRCERGATAKGRPVNDQ